MKKIGIITINDNNNYGNRLQNYAVCEIFNKMGMDGITIKNNVNSNMQIFKEKIKYIAKMFFFKKNYDRVKNFKMFNKNIKFSDYCIRKDNIPCNINEKYDYFVVGSDQVWNPGFGRLSDIDLLTFATNNKKVALSASFGVSELSKENQKKVRDELSKFKAISVREEAGRNIAKKATNRDDIEVLIDPTMMINSSDWDKVLKKPRMLKNDRFILNYFLGELSDERKNEIYRFAQENNCEVINILDKNSKFYACGPSEFLYLEKNAVLICTDSFHSSVFAILYKRPLLIFEREKTKMQTTLKELLRKKFRCGRCGHGL